MDNLISSIYQQRLNLQPAIFSRIAHEDAMIAIVYKVTQPNGLPFILKICPRPEDYAREVYFLNYFANTLPVPKIIDVVPPDVGVDGAVLMEYLPGNLLGSADYNELLAYELGSVLAHIHLNRCDGYGDLTQPETLIADPRIYFTQKFEEGLGECKDNLPIELLTRCRQYFDDHVDLLLNVDGPCIIHRDFRPGNIIVHDGKLQGIIDWASARAGFAEDDFTLEQGEWPINPITTKAFLAGYASIRPVPDYQTVMPLLRLNRAIAIIGVTIKNNTWQDQDAKIYQRERHFLEINFS